MKLTEYTYDYKRNLILYWRQFYPNWEIPAGFHVHHIIPKSLFDDNDISAHYPSNLIALHSDDHATIHKLRGDKTSKSNFITIAGHRKRNGYYSPGMTGKHHSTTSKKKIGAANSVILKGRKLSTEHKKNISDGCTGMVRSKHTSETKIKQSKAKVGKRLYSDGMMVKYYYPGTESYGFKVGRC